MRPISWFVEHVGRCVLQTISYGNLFTCRNFYIENTDKAYLLFALQFNSKNAIGYQIKFFTYSLNQK